MPCEIAYFVDNEKYNMTLFLINFYICLIIIITLLILANTIYNYYIYNNILSEKTDNDPYVIENSDLPKKVSEFPNNKILIGETVDYKLFISLLLDQNMYYNDKYFTLNITNILLDVFMLATIALVCLTIIYVFIGASSFMARFANIFKLKLDISELQVYIKQYCYFINNNNCDDFHIIKMISVFFIILILFIIYIIRYSAIPYIYYTDYLDFTKSKDNNNGVKNIENMLNIICNNIDDFLTDDNNINKIINKLNGHNIYTVNIIPLTQDTNIQALKTASDTALDNFNKASESVDKNNKKKTYEDAKKKYDENIQALKTTSDTALDNFNKASKSVDSVYKNNKKTIYEDAKKKYDDACIFAFIQKIKDISDFIKDSDSKDNKDLDFVKLVIIYLNNKKIYEKNKKIEGQIPELARTYSQSLLNILANIIPYSVFGSLKTDNYDIENVLIGAIPVINKDKINNATCSSIESITFTDFDNFKNDTTTLKETPGCFYNNYLVKLRETTTKLKNSLNNILGFSILSILVILILFYYIYINYKIDNMRWANMTAIKMIRLSWKNPLNWFSILFGYIINFLNRAN